MNGVIKNHYKIGNLLKSIPHDNNTPTLVVVDAGAIPFISGWKTLDIVGLNDAYIAKHKKDAVEYIFSENPDVIILTSTDSSGFVK